MQDMILLTKDGCPQCVSLKDMLGKNPLTKDKLDTLTIVHESEKPEEYTNLVKQHGIQSMPALVYQDNFFPVNQIIPTMMKALRK